MCSVNYQLCCMMEHLRFSRLQDKEDDESHSWAFPRSPQYFCSSWGPEPTTRGQQDSSNGVSPHLQQAPVWSRSARHKEWLSRWAFSTLQKHPSSPPDAGARLSPSLRSHPLRKLKQILHTRTHTHTPFLLKPTHRFHAKKKRHSTNGQMNDAALFLPFRTRTDQQ